MTLQGENVHKRDTYRETNDTRMHTDLYSDVVSCNDAHALHVTATLGYYYMGPHSVALFRSVHRSVYMLCCKMPIQNSITWGRIGRKMWQEWNY